MIVEKTLFCTILTFYLLIHNSHNVGKRQKKFSRVYKKPSVKTTEICVNLEHTSKARHKSCFLRPDTGPCRADIVQWYYDVHLGKCFRFYWGGCQGNGNKFDKKEECMNYCSLNVSNPPLFLPHFCSLSFQYGQCFGYFYRWAWDSTKKNCVRHLYSGCGGNQNNFESYQECMKTCGYSSLDKVDESIKKTTCFPVEVPNTFMSV